MDDDCDGLVDEPPPDASLCAVLNGSGGCVEGACEVDGCDPGFDDCDGLVESGCEAELASDAAHCGVCGYACEPAIACRRGRCDDPVIQVSAGGLHDCALRSSGSVWCWGDRGAALGTDYSREYVGPTRPAGLPPVAQVAAGLEATCAVTRDGRVYCWGHNDMDMLGVGAPMRWTVAPRVVVGLSGVSSVSVSRSSSAVETIHACALRDGDVWCWGFDRGGLGTATPSGSVLAPRRVEGLPPTAAVRCGLTFTCALSETGQVRCWGMNAYNVLGDPMAGPQPGRPLSPAGVSYLDVGGPNGCVVDSTGAVWCWGRGFALTGGAAVPEVVAGLAGPAAMVTVGGSHACVLLVDGHVQCWGFNYFGELGDGTTESRAAPVHVVGLGGVLEVSALGYHTCARTIDEVFCWGDYTGGTMRYALRPQRIALP